MSRLKRPGEVDRMNMADAFKLVLNLGDREGGYSAREVAAILRQVAARLDAEPDANDDQLTDAAGRYVGQWWLEGAPEL